MNSTKTSASSRKPATGADARRKLPGADITPSPRRKPSPSKPASKSEPFVWKPEDWTEKAKLNKKVTLLKSQTSKVCVVKKVLPLHNPHEKGEEHRPWEVCVLGELPNCNRIVKPLYYSEGEPDNLHATVIFAHYPCGDLEQWARKNYWSMNNQIVPESCIWRFFVQMSQALAFIHNKFGPDRERRRCLLIRDFKPENILVVNNGTPYPSFKLHDFDCAKFLQKGHDHGASRCGSFMWQPPETPLINTTAAEIWALGACIYFLAVRIPPVESIHERMTAWYARNKKDPEGAAEYNNVEDYFIATAPRKAFPINQPRMQHIWVHAGGNFELSNHVYSDQLNDCMMECLDHDPEKRPTAERLANVMSLTAKNMLKSIGGPSALVDMAPKFGRGV